MITGFNHNIKHKGRVYHVQTEDSGPKNPHIITHLFVGGNIVSSKKTQYADLVGKPDYETTVRKMMEEQHKQMLRNLVNGAFDTVEVATAYHLDGPAPMNYTATSPATSAMAGGSAFKGLPSQLGKPAGDPASSPTRPPTAPGAPTASASVPRTVTGAMPGAGASPVSPPAPGAGVGGLPRTPTAAVAGVGGLPRTPTAAVAGVGAFPRTVTGTGPGVAGVGAPPQPERSTTIFGEDLISEKSLDEVILSYLAEDLSDLE
jgi:hypothetical protein